MAAHRSKHHEELSTFALLEMTMWLGIAGAVLTLVLAVVTLGHALAPPLLPVVALFFAVSFGAGLALVATAASTRRNGGGRSSSLFG
jgi:hypothetical protein